MHHISRFGNIIVLPQWLIDIYGAAHGDRGAASRRVKHLVERIDQVILPEMFRRKAAELRVSPRGHRGAPSGPRYFQTDDDLVLAVARAIENQRKREPGVRVNRVASVGPARP
jgi:hypothetical protein